VLVIPCDGCFTSGRDWGWYEKSQPGAVNAVARLIPDRPPRPGPDCMRLMITQSCSSMHHECVARRAVWIGTTALSCTKRVALGRNRTAEKLIDKSPGDRDCMTCSTRSAHETAVMRRWSTCRCSSSRLAC